MWQRILVGIGLALALACAVVLRPPRAAPQDHAAVSSAPAAAASRQRAPHRTKGPHRRHHHSRPHTPRGRHHVVDPHDPSPEPVDLNHADADTLVRVLGLDERLAQRIVAVRSALGSFRDLDELGDVAGISPRRVDLLAPLIVLR
ncbi:MAG: helix-hairpin-helix domain-containing protein [Candidatus Eremiobacteraeota bacterium]|nr:helix-hairpin-helix domain-containing protein [Candidatus Eremiobacteraeota bacterium]